MRCACARTISTLPSVEPPSMTISSWRRRDCASTLARHDCSVEALLSTATTTLIRGFSSLTLQYSNALKNMHSEDKPLHLSVVATSRNDNHGGFLTHRMQHFVDGLAAQCARHGLRAELILVEWNPPADRVPLAEELRWPAGSP